MNKVYYLDAAANVSMNDRTIQELIKINGSLAGHGHPSSPSVPGKKSSCVIEEARATIASLIGAKDANQIIFTNSCTQACEWAIKLAYNLDFTNIFTSPFEHNAIFSAVEEYYSESFTELKLNNSNVLVPEEYIDKTVVCVHVQNEIGTIQPLKGLKSKFNYLISDMSQSLGKIYLNVSDLNVDIGIFNSHKYGGPSGVGFFYLKDPALWHEFGTGSRYYKDITGTPSATFIHSSAFALDDAITTLNVRKQNSFEFQVKLENGLENLGFEILGKESSRLPHITFAKSPKENGGIDLLIKLAAEDIHIGLGSACGQLHMGPSRLIKALNRNDNGQDFIRISQWGNYVGKDANYILNKIEKCLSR